MAREDRPRPCRRGDYPARGSPPHSSAMGNYRRYQPLPVYRGQFLAQLGRRMAPDHGPRHRPYPHSHPDVLLLLPALGRPCPRRISLWPLSYSSRLRPGKGLSLVVLPPDFGGRPRNRPGGLQRMGPQPLALRGIFLRPLPLALRRIRMARGWDVRGLGRNYFPPPRYRKRNPRGTRIAHPDRNRRCRRPLELFSRRYAPARPC